MDLSQKLINELRVKKHRITRVREAILSLLVKAKEPLSPINIRSILEKSDIVVDKTTIYRELYFLQNKAMVRELQLGDQAKYYEIVTENHHHHVVCIKCDKVEDVTLVQDLGQEEKRIAKSKKFKILKHSLEFYGLCRSCQ